MLVHGKKAIIGDQSEKHIKEVLKNKGIELMEIEHEEFDNIGSLIVTSKNSGIISPVFTERVVKKIEKFLSLELTETTINNRGVFLSSGIVFNEKGILLGEDSLTEEVMDATKSLS